MDVSSGKYYRLNGSASVIWNALEHEQTAEKLIVELKEQFEVDPQKCQHETLAFLRELAKSGLVTLGS